MARGMGRPQYDCLPGITPLTPPRGLATSQPRLISLQTAIFLAPAIVCLLGDCDPTTRIPRRPALRQHDHRAAFHDATERK